ncbi:RNA 2',3'-cyclic phosphodiesterase [Nesterenkonia ebinurensis]|uniref:RNA 2',3'-cyclic phosphodiesterase n=1 Tax=Nesterenkonia ebinurensis TaxID=2608252 RepID=UPI00123CEF81|nr:RNA 2',3'-cyclic phosphodiesterase [Nesterenkonia ebinurensis]
MRLFVGFMLPDHVNTHLGWAVNSVNDAVPTEITGYGRPALRWVQPSARHITLAFYGEVPAGAAEDLAARLQNELVDVSPLELRLRGAGVFTGRTLWVGVQEQTASEHSNGSSPLIDLMRRVEGVGAEYARNPDLPTARERRRAHVTLARTRDRRKGEPQIRAHAEALAVYEGPVWTTDTAHLMRSELGGGKSGAPLYTSLAEVPLGAR